ncbi:MAG: carbon-nitrogen hydrolase family protein [Roseovarius sp.]
MKLGLYQCDAAFSSAEARVAALEAHIAGRGLDLVVCPELFATGYDAGADYAALAEPPDGPFAQRMAALARKHDVALAWGYPERGAGVVYNSAALIGRDGALIANHRKRLASPGSFEERAFANGEKLTFAEVAGIRLAMIICYEVEFPESLRQAARGGAQLVLVPTALGGDWGFVAEKVVPTRAFENGIYVAYADNAGALGGLTFFGGSRIVAPDGSVTVAETGQESFISAEIEPDRVIKAQARLPYLRDSLVL